MLRQVVEFILKDVCFYMGTIKYSFGSFDNEFHDDICVCDKSLLVYSGDLPII